MTKKLHHISESGFTLIELLVTMVLGLIVLLGLYQLLDQNQKVYRAQQQMTIMNNQVRSTMEAMVRAIRSAGNNSFALDGEPMIYEAQESLIRVLSDLPKDQHNDDGAGTVICGTSNDYSFDITDCEGNTILGDEDDENENGDERLNDPYEDVTFFLSGTDLILRQFSTDAGQGGALDSDGGGPIAIDPNPPYTDEDDVIAENILELTFQYLSDSVTAITMGGSPLEVDEDDLSSIQIVRIKIVAQTNDRDRATGRFHTIELTSDVDLRNRGN
jgi:prepilin-type N-terminal cleavage/methylation domain-containing protein